MAGTAGEGTENPVRMHAGLRVLYGGALALIGLGSGVYHASLTFVGQFFDVFGMYLLGTFLLLYALVRVRAVASRAMVPLYVVSNAVLATLLWTVPILRRVAFAVLILAVIVVELRARAATASIRMRYFWGALMALGLAFGIWVLDITRRWCVPTSYVQGHAIWHVLTAVAAGLIFVYYWSESRADVTT